MEFMRAVNEPSDPARVAAAVVARVASWLPATRRAVLEPAPGGPAVTAHSGLAPGEEEAVRAIGARVLRRARIWRSADLGRDARLPRGPAVSALALPLTCRARTVAALVALGGRPSTCAPGPRPALRLALESAAISLDAARRVQRAERRAATDDLTGLCAARALTDTLDREAARAARGGRPLSLLVIDLDGFKRVNDRHGHPRGSLALIEVAALLRRGLRRTDLAARFGGDEFAVVLPDTDRGGAAAAGERLRARIARHVFLRREGLAVRLTASVGARTDRGPGVTAAALLDRADRALYRAKAGGGDRVECDGGPDPRPERGAM